MYIVTPCILGLRGPCDHSRDYGCRPARPLINQGALSVTVDGIPLFARACFSG
jgi:hypothetical protein